MPVSYKEQIGIESTSFRSSYTGNRIEIECVDGAYLNFKVYSPEGEFIADTSATPHAFVKHVLAGHMVPLN